MDIRSLAVSAPALTEMPSDTHRLKDASQQFEAMLISKILATAQESDQDEGAFGCGQSSSAMMDFAQQQVAQQISAHGGFGLSRMMLRQLEARSNQSSPPPIPVNPAAR